MTQTVHPSPATPSPTHTTAQCNGAPGTADPRKSRALRKLFQRHAVRGDDAVPRLSEAQLCALLSEVGFLAAAGRGDSDSLVGKLLTAMGSPHGEGVTEAAFVDVMSHVTCARPRTLGPSSLASQSPVSPDAPPPPGLPPSPVPPPQAPRPPATACQPEPATAQPARNCAAPAADSHAPLLSPTPLPQSEPPRRQPPRGDKQPQSPLQPRPQPQPQLQQQLLSPRVSSRAAAVAERPPAAPVPPQPAQPQPSAGQCGAAGRPADGRLLQPRRAVLHPQPAPRTHAAAESELSLIEAELRQRAAERPGAAALLAGLFDPPDGSAAAADPVAAAEREVAFGRRLLNALQAHTESEDAHLWRCQQKRAAWGAAATAAPSNDAPAGGGAGGCASSRSRSPSGGGPGTLPPQPECGGRAQQPACGHSEAGPLSRAPLQREPPLRRSRTATPSEICVPPPHAAAPASPPPRAGSGSASSGTPVSHDLEGLSADGAGGTLEEAAEKAGLLAGSPSAPASPQRGADGWQLRRSSGEVAPRPRPQLPLAAVSVAVPTGHISESPVTGLPLIDPGRYPALPQLEGGWAPGSAPGLHCACCTSDGGIAIVSDTAVQVIDSSGGVEHSVALDDVAEVLGTRDGWLGVVPRSASSEVRGLVFRPEPPPDCGADGEAAQHRVADQLRHTVCLAAEARTGSSPRLGYADTWHDIRRRTCAAESGPTAPQGRVLPLVVYVPSRGAVSSSGAARSASPPSSKPRTADAATSPPRDWEPEAAGACNAPRCVATQCGPDGSLDQPAGGDCPAAARGTATPSAEPAGDAALPPAEVQRLRGWADALAAEDPPRAGFLAVATWSGARFRVTLPAAELPTLRRSSLLRSLARWSGVEQHRLSLRPSSSQLPGPHADSATCADLGIVSGGVVLLDAADAGAPSAGAAPAAAVDAGPSTERQGESVSPPGAAQAAHAAAAPPHTPSSADNRAFYAAHRQQQPGALPQHPNNPQEPRSAAPEPCRPAHGSPPSASRVWSPPPSGARRHPPVASAQRHSHAQPLQPLPQEAGAQQEAPERSAAVVHVAGVPADNRLLYPQIRAAAAPAPPRSQPSAAAPQRQAQTPLLAQLVSQAPARRTSTPPASPRRHISPPRPQRSFSPDRHGVVHPQCGPLPPALVALAQKAAQRAALQQPPGSRMLGPGTRPELPAPSRSGSSQEAPQSAALWVVDGTANAVVPPPPLVRAAAQPAAPLWPAPAQRACCATRSNAVAALWPKGRPDEAAAGWGRPDEAAAVDQAAADELGYGDAIGYPAAPAGQGLVVLEF
eukprot:TRINITY_DN9860_c0_g1_i2.p1 TRINITY_DN9860_c0_g1~~TRINITY_DN9860_c0_g1_i2.p1  ORF type:complete len:1300 (+),score=145.19 TRINITY_DN9860_c0_g1_i2:71-3970(+)